MKGRVRCNNCGVKSCTDLYKDVNIIKKCSHFIPLDSFKIPLLVHLMEGRKATGTTNVLDHFGFRIEEVGRYPFFRLHLKGRR